MDDRDYVDRRLRARIPVPAGTGSTTKPETVGGRAGIQRMCARIPRGQAAVLSHTVRRLRSFRSRRLYAVGTAVLVGCGLCACGAQSNGSAASKVSSSKETQTSARHQSSVGLQNSVSQAVVGSMVPTNGAQLSSEGEAVQDFFSSIASKATDSCLAADGLPAVEQEPSSGAVGDTQLPNLNYLSSQHSFATQSTTSGADPTRGMSASEKRSYTAAVKRCTPKLSTPAFESGTGAQSIFNAWTNIMLKTIGTSPAVRAANRAGAACSRSTSFPASTYEDEWQVAAGDGLALYMKGETSAGNQAEARGAAVFLRCFGPAVKTVDRLLAAEAKPFLAKYATTLRQLEDATAKQVAELSAKYDVPFGSTSRRSR